MPFFLVYGAEAILPTDLEYGSSRRRAYDDRRNQTSREDSLDQLERLGTWPYYTRHGISSLCDATTPRGSVPRPPGGGPGASATTRRPRAPQAHTSLGRAVHHHQDFEARNIQAGQQSRRGLQQRLEHLTTTSLLPLRCFQVVHMPHSLYIHK
jgi:hypothetical protein